MVSHLIEGEGENDRNSGDKQNVPSGTLYLSSTASRNRISTRVLHSRWNGIESHRKGMKMHTVSTQEKQNVCGLVRRVLSGKVCLPCVLPGIITAGNILFQLYFIFKRRR